MPNNIHIVSTEQFSGTICGSGQRQQITTIPSLATCPRCIDGESPTPKTLAYKTHYQTQDATEPYCKTSQGNMTKVSADWREVDCWKCINYSRQQFKINKSGKLADQQR